VAAGGAFWAVALQADNAIVGHLLGATALGLYAVAYTYGALPGVMLGNLVNQVAFPVFSQTVLDPDRLREHFMRFVRISAITVLPVTALGVALSGVAVEWVLGPKWEAAIVPIQLFLVMGAWRGLFPSGEVFRSLGRVNVELIIGIVGAPAVVLSALIGSTRGISTVALLVTTVFVASGFTTAVFACRAIGLALSEVLPAILPSLALSVALGFMAHRLATQGVLHPLLTIVVGCLVTLALYGGALYVVPGGGEIRRIVIGRR
jgi:O-antigen/teichoic acid export membrane protein